MIILNHSSVTSLFLGLSLGIVLVYLIGIIPNKIKFNKSKKIWKKNKINIEKKYYNLLKEINQLSTEKSVLKQVSYNIPKLETKIKELIISKNQLIKQNIELEKKISELNALLLSERKLSDEKTILLNNTKKSMLNEFKIVLGNIFREEGVRINDLNKNQIGAIITPLKNQLSDFKKKVEDVYDKESRDRSALLNEIHNLKTLNENISKDAINLAKALKGDSRTQGNWGELILERVLELSGLQKGRIYDLQVHLKHSEGDRYRPDAIIRLPGGRDVIIDAKVSLKAYESSFSSNNETNRRIALKNHITSIKNHINILSSKHYEKLEGIRSLDFVLMFIPIEEAFFIAIKEEISILSEAYGKNIFIVCPSTLLVTLRTIDNIWKNVDQNRNSEQIAKQAGEMYDKFVSFTNAIEDIGKFINKANNSYLLAKKRLIDGKGNLSRRAQKIKALGLKTKKTLSKSFTSK